MEVRVNVESSNSVEQLQKCFDKHRKNAFEQAKAINQAYIIEGEWIVRVMSDNTRIPIKHVGNTNVKVSNYLDKLI